MPSCENLRYIFFLEYCAVMNRAIITERLSENTADARRVTIPLRNEKERGERKTIAFPERAILSPTNGM